MQNGLVQLIRIRKSIRQMWVNEKHSKCQNHRLQSTAGTERKVHNKYTNNYEQTNNSFLTSGEVTILPNSDNKDDNI